MKVCVYGAGAIGGHIGALLSLVGVEVTLIARGPHLEVLKKDGLRLTTAEGAEHQVRIAATEDPAEAGPQDYVIVTLKAYVEEPPTPNNDGPPKPAQVTSPKRLAQKLEALRESQRLADSDYHKMRDILANPFVQ